MVIIIGNEQWRQEQRGKIRGVGEESVFEAQDLLEALKIFRKEAEEVERDKLSISVPVFVSRQGIKGDRRNAAYAFRLYTEKTLDNTLIKAKKAFVLLQ